METTRTQHRITTSAAALIGAAAFVLTPAVAHASRIPADPVAFVPTPSAVAQLVTSGHAANVIAALSDHLDDLAGR
jgi:hypothetical protein